MASPFRVLRKYLKPIMAVSVVLLMFSWVVGDSLFNWLAGDRNPGRSIAMDAGTVAVRWDGGKLTNQQLETMVMRRRMLNAFLQQVEREGGRSAYEAGVEPSQLRVQRLLGAETPEQGVERSVVETKLASDAAREAGMRVSDESVVHYLDQLGRGNVTRDAMRSILQNLSSRVGRVSMDDIIAALREEMLAQNYLNSNRYAMVTVTPEQRWKDWLRVNERVVVEAAAVPVDSLLVDVKEPTDAELQAFYDKYKDREASPEIAYGTTELPSAIPGFRIPRKVDLSFIEANYDAFLTKAEEKVTDEEIAKYYEEHKDPMFVKADTGLMEDKGTKADETKADEAKKDDASATPPATDATRPATDAPPPAAEEKGTEKDADKEKKQSSLEPRSSNSPFRQVAFFQEEKKDDAGKADEKDAKSTDPAATPAPPLTPAAPPAATDATTPPAASASPAMPVIPAKPKEFDPLDQVKDQIRRLLASDKVAEELKKLVDGIIGPLDGDFNKYQRAVLTADADKQPVPPVPATLTDLAPIAEKSGLKSGKTGPISFLEMRNTPIGKSGLADSNHPLLSALFGSKEIDLYQPFVTVDIDGNRFIVVKTADTPGRVPKLDEVKADVVKAWKAQEAAKLAEKQAKELAKKDGETKAPLDQFFADDKSIKVVRTDPFSELTGGDVGIVNGQLQRQPYRLSQPEGIVAPGPDFMKEVFSLKDGEVGAALNHDHTIAYVIRVVEHQPPITELRTAYLGEANNWPGLMSETQRHAAELAQGLAANLTDGTHVKWERDADKVQRPGEPAEEEPASPDAG